jgi:glycosyltransferase involved in cell wall biosynthesis
MLKVGELVSVIIPTKNRVDFLFGAIKSVQHQTWKNIELIVVNDCSVDGTKEFLDGNIDNLIAIHNKKSLGGAISRNIGVKASCGKYIAFLDDDDEWHPEKIQKQMELITSNKNISAVTCNYISISSYKRVKKNKINCLQSFQDILMHNTFGGASMYLSKKETLSKIGMFDESLPSGQDWDLWIKTYLQGEIACCKGYYVYYNNKHHERISTSWDKSYIGRRKIYNKYRKEMLPDTRKHHLIMVSMHRLFLADRNILYRVNKIKYILIKCIGRRFFYYLKIYLLMEFKNRYVATKKNK